ncbi:MAG: thioredoxin family protein [Sedimentisphaerales bacterium]
MKNIWKIIIVLILASSVVAVVLLKNSCPCELRRVENKNQPVVKSVEPNHSSLEMTIKVVDPVKKLPRLVDLGADKCIPCKMMKPALEELDKEYKSKLQVEFYDVWKEPAFAQQYAIRVIPTQIFFGLDGKELFRHEGYFSKEDILVKWKEFGFDLSK